jgi:hypothetical protein
VSDDDIRDCGVPDGAINPNSTNYPDHGRYGDLPLNGKIPTSEQRIDPGKSVRSSDHKTKRLVILIDM